MRSVGSKRVVWAAAALVLLGSTPVSAQGLFDFLFGGPMRRESPSVRSYADPNSDRYNPGVRRSERSPSSGEASVSGAAYCVRLCDGRYFPISVRGNAGAEMCKSFCPAATTKVFSGGDLRYASSSDGKRYSDLPNAYVYREKLVAGCTCDGKSPTGLVRLQSDDPTLRPGDIVATGNGLMTYRGGNGANSQYSAISSTPGISAKLREQLSATRVAPGRKPIEDKPDPEADGEAMMSRNVSQRDQAAR